MVRLADVKRGWGKFCNKSCKAKYQTKKTGKGKPDKQYTPKVQKQVVHDVDYDDPMGEPYGYDYLSV